jgi:hypothetical protein
VLLEIIEYSDRMQVNKPVGARRKARHWPFFNPGRRCPPYLEQFIAAVWVGVSAL